MIGAGAAQSSSSPETETNGGLTSCWNQERNSARSEGLRPSEEEGGQARRRAHFAEEDVSYFVYGISFLPPAPLPTLVTATQTTTEGGGEGGKLEKLCGETAGLSVYGQRKERTMRSYIPTSVVCEFSPKL